MINYVHVCVCVPVRTRRLSQALEDCPPPASQQASREESPYCGKVNCPLKSNRFKG